MNIPKDRSHNYDQETEDYILDPLEDKISSQHLHNKILSPSPDEEEVDVEFFGEEDEDDLSYEEYGGYE